MTSTRRGDELDRWSIACRRAVEQHLRAGGGDSVWYTLPISHDTIPTGEYDALTLAAVNAALWERENRIRALITSSSADEPSDNKQIADLAREICKLNDLRRGCVRQLNGGQGEEKIYT